MLVEKSIMVQTKHTPHISIEISVCFSGRVAYFGFCIFYARYINTAGQPEFASEGGRSSGVFDFFLFITKIKFCVFNSQLTH